MYKRINFALLDEAEATLKVKILSYSLVDTLARYAVLKLRVLEVYRGPYQTDETVNVKWINSTFGHPQNLDEFVNKSAMGGIYGGYGPEFYIALERKIGSDVKVLQEGCSSPFMFATNEGKLPSTGLLMWNDLIHELKTHGFFE